MGDPKGFLKVARQNPLKQEVGERLRHCREFYQPISDDELSAQASRCMDCGVPFCHGVGCPLGNNIPEFNELVYRKRWKDACDLLHVTSNFPEITGRICPALCEASCVNYLGGEAVTVRQIELAIVEKGWREGWIVPSPPEDETGKCVAVIGSGPAGLAAAQQLRRAGHKVVVYEKSDKPGGILRYGIPDFKLEKHILDRRIGQIADEGVRFEVGVEAGADITARYLQKKFDAICLCGGTMIPRDLPVPGRAGVGIHYAMAYLEQNNRRVAGQKIPAGQDISAANKRVLVIGGGDTGSDCLGTALRQGALEVRQIELMPRLPEGFNPDTPWPKWPMILRDSASHEEGGTRDWSVNTTEFLLENGVVSGVRCQRVEWKKDDAGRMEMLAVSDSEFVIKADLVLLALGFVGPVRQGLLDDLGLEYTGRGMIKVDENMMTSLPGVFTAGDMQTGAWLVVGGMAGGRRLAHYVDLYLMGESSLPCPLPPQI